MVSRLQWIILPLGLVGISFVLGYLGWMWARADGEIIHGRVTIFHYDQLNPYTGGGCTQEKAGPGEFADLRRGTPVVVTDETGAVLGEGGLSEGSDVLSTCWFRFRVGPLPRAATYTIRVAEREPATFSYEELEAAGWNVTLDFGGQQSP
jgi:hypothetical protein